MSDHAGFTDMGLMVIVLGTVALALAVNIAVAVGWLRRKP